ncbi:MAG: GH3 auxin-responsive promoter family protein [Lachnospiraceae bacterium]|nr:GH3 auxin-responsive promoter family protein [Lachnospiraceae bacterium]
MKEEIKRVIGRERYEECLKAATVNRDTLGEILRDNRDSAIGRKYSFSDIKDPDEFRKRVPISDYDDFADDIADDLDGKKHLLSSYPVITHACTSGSSSKRKKLIPVTDKMLSSYAQDPDLYIEQILRENGGKRFHVNVFRTELHGAWNDPVMMSVYYRNKWESNLADEKTYVGGSRLLFGENPGDTAFAKAYAALLTEDIVVLETVFQYDFLPFFRYIEENWQLLVDTAKKGSIPDSVSLSKQIREELEAFTVRSGRLQKIEAECKKGFKGIAKRLWPSLRLLSGISSRAFFAEEAMMEYYGGDIPRYFFLYGSSEFYYGNPVAENSYGYVLMPRHNFFEFLPFDEEDDSEDTLLPEQLEEGKLYEVIVTTYGGLYRYRTFDIIKVTGFIGESPVAEFVTRKGLALNLVGEKTSLEQLELAVHELKNNGIRVESYCFAADMKTTPGRYLVALEIPEGEMPDADNISEQIDALIKQQNWDYEDLRNLNELGAPGVLLFDPKDFRVFMEKNGLTGGHEKPKHIAPGGFMHET